MHKLHQHRRFDDAFIGELLGKPKMACIERLDFNAHAQVGHHLTHRAQHAGVFVMT